jgi:hypothetical protein
LNEVMTLNGTARGAFLGYVLAAVGAASAGCSPAPTGGAAEGAGEGGDALKEGGPSSACGLTCPAGGAWAGHLVYSAGPHNGTTFECEPGEAFDFPAGAPECSVVSDYDGNLACNHCSGVSFCDGGEGVPIERGLTCPAGGAWAGHLVYSAGPHNGTTFECEPGEAFTFPWDAPECSVVSDYDGNLACNHCSGVSFCDGGEGVPAPTTCR